MKNQQTAHRTTQQWKKNLNIRGNLHGTLFCLHSEDISVFISFFLIPNTVISLESQRAIREYTDEN